MTLAGNLASGLDDRGFSIHVIQDFAQSSKPFLLYLQSHKLITADVRLNGQKLEEVSSSKYLGATLCKDGICSPEIRIRLASAMAAMARSNRIW